MGQKVNPIGLRLGINKTWSSRWYAADKYADLILEDYKIRKFLEKELKNAGISSIIIERPAKKAHITIYTARPGVVIGKKGQDIGVLKKKLINICNQDVTLNIVEVRKPEVDAELVAKGIAQQIEKRVSYKRAMKKALQNAVRLGAKGIRVRVGGRLGGAEIARHEEYKEGRIPLHTLRSDVDYGVSTAFTTYGAIGIKVWIYKGDVVHEEKMNQERNKGHLAGKEI